MTATAKRNATLKRTRTMAQGLGYELVPCGTKPVEKAVKRAVKATPQDWRKRPASDPQVRRINGLEKALGYKVSSRKVIGNAGQASDLYKALKAEFSA